MKLFFINRLKCRSNINFPCRMHSLCPVQKTVVHLGPACTWGPSRGDPPNAHTLGEWSSSKRTAMHLSDSDMSVCLTCIIHERPEWGRREHGSRAAEQSEREARGTQLKRQILGREWERGQCSTVLSGVHTWCRWGASFSCRKRLDLLL